MAYQQNPGNYNKNDKKTGIGTILLSIMLIGLGILLALLLLTYNYRAEIMDKLFGAKEPVPNSKLKEEIMEPLSEMPVTEGENPITLIPDKEEGAETDDDNKPFITVEKMPSFPGGEKEMARFIGNNLQYPRKAQEEGIQGRVLVRFVVSKDGQISDINIIRGIDPECDKEVVRIIKAMPRWTPGYNNGKAVSVYFTLPVVFKLK